MINETTINQTVRAFEIELRKMVDERRASGTFSVPGAPGISVIVAAMPTAAATRIMQSKSAAEDIATVAMEAAGTFATVIQAATGILGKRR